MGKGKARTMVGGGGVVESAAEKYGDEAYYERPKNGDQEVPSEL